MRRCLSSLPVLSVISRQVAVLYQLMVESLDIRIGSKLLKRSHSYSGNYQNDISGSCWYVFSRFLWETSIVTWIKWNFGQWSICSLLRISAETNLQSQNQMRISQQEHDMTQCVPLDWYGLSQSFIFLTPKHYLEREQNLLAIKRWRWCLSNWTDSSVKKERRTKIHSS